MRSLPECWLLSYAGTLRTFRSTLARAALVKAPLTLKSRADGGTMPRRANPYTTFIPGRVWAPVLTVPIPALIQYRVTETSRTAGRLFWRRFSGTALAPVVQAECVGLTAVVTFIITDIYAVLELYKDSVPTSSYSILVEQIFP